MVAELPCKALAEPFGAFWGSRTLCHVDMRSLAVNHVPYNHWPTLTSSPEPQSPHSQKKTHRGDTKNTKHTKAGKIKIAAIQTTLSLSVHTHMMNT